MATYYVKTAANGGSDAANGTSPATAWATINKALGTTGIASGDTVYVAPGVYREVVALNLTNPTAETKIIGDVLGTRFNVAPNEVRLTCYTTDDETAPSTSALVTPTTRDFITWENFVFHSGGGTGAAFPMGNGSVSWTFRNCYFLNARGSNSGNIFLITTQADGSPSNILFENCYFSGHNSSVIMQITLARALSADYDMGIIFRNCIFVGGTITMSVSSGSDTFLPGGAVYEHCFFRNCVLSVSGTNHSLSIPTIIRYCVFDTAGSTALSGGAAGTIDEDYNRFISANSRSNVDAGANSITGNVPAILLDFGQSQLWGAPIAPFMSPIPNSPTFNFVSDGADTVTFDHLRRPRPSGTLNTNKTCGPFEVHNTAIQETTTTQAGAVSIVLNGPANHEFLIPVNAASTTISIYARYDSNHGSTNKPQVMLMASGDANLALSATSGEAALGIAEIKTMTAAVNTWEQLTFTAFTPSQKTFVRMRVISRAANGSGKAFFDSLAVA